MSDSIRTQVTEILAHAGVRFSAIYVGEDKNEFGSGRTSDKWACMFTQTEGPAKAITFDFFTGIAHRKAPQWGPGVRGYDNGPAPRPGTLLYAQWTQQAKPEAPHPADVLYSLIRDSSAADQSFKSWCGDFGYDSDSRKALATYEACQKNAEQMRSFFARDTLESLTNALQDY